MRLWLYSTTEYKGKYWWKPTGGLVCYDHMGSNYTNRVSLEVKSARTLQRVQVVPRLSEQLVLHPMVWNTTIDIVY